MTSNISNSNDMSQLSQAPSTIVSLSKDVERANKIKELRQGKFKLNKNYIQLPDDEKSGFIVIRSFESDKRPFHSRSNSSSSSSSISSIPSNEFTGLPSLELIEQWMNWSGERSHSHLEMLRADFAFHEAFNSYKFVTSLNERANSETARQRNVFAIRQLGLIKQELDKNE
jgi:hypothetical protein